MGLQIVDIIIKKIYNLCVIKENIDYNHQECTRDGPDEGTATTRFCEKGANFRKKDLRDGIAKKTFRYPACKQDFFILTEEKTNG